MTTRFNPPPNWPQPPAGWVYPVDWQPDPHWPAPPDGWPFWVDEGTTPGAPQPQAGPQAMLISPLTPTTSADTPTQPKPGHTSRRPGSGATRSGFVKHWKRNVAIAAAAAPRHRGPTTWVRRPRRP